MILSTLLGYVRTSAVPINHLRESLSTSSSASPCSQIGGALMSSPLMDISVLSAAKHTASTSSLCIMISRLNRFTFVTALLLPVIRLGLMLPVHPQGLGTEGRPLLTRQACPAVILSAYKDRSHSQWKNSLRCFRSSHMFLLLYHSLKRSAIKINFKCRFSADYFKLS